MQNLFPEAFSSGFDLFPEKMASGIPEIIEAT